VHSPGPTNSCSRYEHGYAPMENQVSSSEQTTYERKFGTQPVRKLGTSCISKFYSEIKFFAVIVFSDTIKICDRPDDGGSKDL
jgi:hypothetical protein